MNYKVCHTNTLRTRKVKNLCRLEEMHFYLKVMTNMYIYGENMQNEEKNEQENIGGK
jgi:hypothetical protein